MPKTMKRNRRFRRMSTQAHYIYIINENEKKRKEKGNIVNENCWGREMKVGKLSKHVCLFVFLGGLLFVLNTL